MAMSNFQEVSYVDFDVLFVVTFAPRYFDVLPWGYCSSYHSGVGSSFQ